MENLAHLHLAKCKGESPPASTPARATLTIRAAKNPGYYEQPEFARDDYYTERGSVPGRWVGRGAETLDSRRHAGARAARNAAGGQVAASLARSYPAGAGASRATPDST